MTACVASECAPERVHIQNVDLFAADVRSCMDSAREGIAVYLNVYDVSHGETIHHVNELLASTYSPLKFGGIFHVGVQIFNEEWNYGSSRIGSGVTSVVPRSDHQHRFKQQVRLPNTMLSVSSIEKVIARLYHDYCGTDYNVIERNCCHFAEDLCHRLGVGPIPAWVQRAGNICHSLHKMSRILSFEDMPVDWLASCASDSRLDTVDQHKLSKLNRRRIVII